MTKNSRFQLEEGLLFIDVQKSNIVPTTVNVDLDMIYGGWGRWDTVALNIANAHWFSWPSAAILVGVTSSGYNLWLLCPPQSANEIEIFSFDANLFSVQRGIVSMEVDLSKQGRVSLEAKAIEREIHVEFRAYQNIEYQKGVERYFDLRLLSSGQILSVVGKHSPNLGGGLVGKLEGIYHIDFILAAHRPGSHGFTFLFVGKWAEQSETDHRIRDVNGLLEWLVGS